jgi:hypothetical protein
MTMSDFAYGIVFEGHPPFEAVGQPFISAPARRGDTFYITFSGADPLAPDYVLWDSLVGRECRVVRRAPDGPDEECGGILQAIEPIRVHAHGIGWQRVESA